MGKNKKLLRKNIPKALREQCWISNFGQRFKHKCYISWCSNIITVFDFHVAHNKPVSKGGKTCLRNLRPVCSRCNHNMNAQYSIAEWDDLIEPHS